MPGPQRHLLNEDKICRKLKKSEFEGGKTMRKIRVLCSDPYATDYSSSEDEGTKEVKAQKRNGFIGVKRFVMEIQVPIQSLDSESSSYHSSSFKFPKRVLPKHHKMKKTFYNKVSSEEFENTHKTSSLSNFSSTVLLEASSSCASESSEATEAMVLPSSPSSVLDISASGSTSIAEGSDVGGNAVVKVAEPVRDILEEPFFELDSLIFDDFGSVGEFVGLNDIPLFAFGEEREDDTTMLGFDFDLDPEAFAWINL